MTLGPLRSPSKLIRTDLTSEADPNLAAPVETPTISASALCELFGKLFLERENTMLVSGADEPLYTPATTDRPAKIFFRHDYAASALHEVAHWCIAGRQRRALEDYGYWYAPDGRSVEQQRQFALVESRPQALEWCFAQACAMPFMLSIDNLDAPPDAVSQQALKQGVLDAARTLQRDGLPPRGERFFNALGDTFRRGFAASALRFYERDLR